MVAKQGIINIALAIILIFMVLKTYDVWQQDQSLPATQTLSDGRNNVAMKMPKLERRPSEAFFDSIVSQNLFSPIRAEYLPPDDNTEKTEIVVEKKIQGKTIRLYGVVIMKDYASALISNPEKTSGDRPTLWVKKGERIGDLKVDEIQTDSIVFQDGNKKYKILLHEKKRSAPAPRIAEDKEDTPTVVTTETNKKEIKAASQKESQSSDDKYEIIKTPFGEIKRRKK